ncbi:DMT family transporter [Streptomyces sp. NBC_00258]
MEPHAKRLFLSAVIDGGDGNAVPARSSRTPPCTPRLPQLFYFLTQVLRCGMALRVAYGIWGACGVTFIALMGAGVFDAPLSPTMLPGIGLVIIGVLAVEIRAENRGTPRTEGHP